MEVGEGGGVGVIFGGFGWVNYEIYETQKNKKHNLVLELYILKGSEAGDGYSS